MKRLIPLAMLLVFVGGIAHPAFAQTVQQVEIDRIIPVLESIVAKAESDDFGWDPVDESTYSEWAEGPVDSEPQIRLTGVSYLYIPFAEPVELSEFRSTMQGWDLIGAEGQAPDFPEGSLPTEMSEPASGAWVVLGQLSQPLTPALCADHHWRFYVTVANPGRVPFEANERRPGSIFDGGDVMYGSQIECDGVSTFVDATNETGGAGAWPGFINMFYNDASVVGAVIPDQLFSPDALARTSLEERPPVGVEGDVTNTAFTTDSPVGEPLKQVSTQDRWPECAEELGLVSAAEEPDPDEPVQEEPGPEEAPEGDASTATTQGVVPNTNQESSSDTGFDLVFLLGVFPVLLILFVLAFYFISRKGKTEPPPHTSGVLGDLPPGEPFEPSGGIPNLTPTNPEVQRVAGDIISEPPESVDDPVEMASRFDAAYQDLLEALALTGWIGFSDYVETSDTALSDAMAEVVDPPVPIPPDNLCERLRDLCNDAKAELERRRQILNQKEGVLAQAEAAQSGLEKELDLLNEALKGGVDRIESEGDVVDRVDRTLFDRYVDQCRSAYEADLAAAGDDQAARSAASKRFDKAMDDARSPEAREKRRKGTAQARDDVASDLADAKADTRKARDDRNLARHSVDKAGEHVARVCSKADECDQQVVDAAAREEEIRQKIKEQQARDDAERERRHKEWDDEDRGSPHPTPPTPPPLPTPGGAPPEKGDDPEIPEYLKSRPCVKGTEVVRPIAARNDVRFIDPTEPMTIRFKRIVNPPLTEWLKRADPDSYSEGSGEYSEGSVPAQEFLNLADDDIRQLISADAATMRDSYEGVASMSIRVTLTVRTATFSCSEVWKCNAEGKYVFDRYRSGPVGREFPSIQREREFDIHGLNVAYLFREVQGWIRGYVPEHQQFCKDCESGRLGQ